MLVHSIKSKFIPAIKRTEIGWNVEEGDFWKARAPEGGDSAAGVMLGGERGNTGLLGVNFYLNLFCIINHK